MGAQRHELRRSHRQHVWQVAVLAGLLLLSGGAPASAGAAPDSVAEGCAFAPVANPAEFESRLREWLASFHPEPIVRWGLGIDRNRARVELQLRDDSFVVSWALDAQCNPTQIRVESSAAEPGPRPDEKDVRVLAADLAAVTELHRNTGEWKLDIALLAGSLVLLLLGSVHILYREAVQHRASSGAMGALLLLWILGLGLRLTLSPQTFLHEGYHIAETLSAYLAGDMPPAYGNTGPMLFRLAGVLTQNPLDLRTIFLTNVVVASLAIPALALFDLAIFASWPRALCTAALLCVLPLHLRYSAAEDLFIQATTFGIWSLALFALFLRSRRWDMLLCTVLALSLAMQARPEMMFFPAWLVALALLLEPRSWRTLVSTQTLLGGALLALLLLPRLLDLQEALHAAPTPHTSLPGLTDYIRSLVLLQSHVTPRIYIMLSLLGLGFGLRHQRGFHLWVLFAFLFHTLITLSIFNNVPYGLRSQLLPTCCALLLAGGVAPLWREVWQRLLRSGGKQAALAESGLGMVCGAAILAAIGIGVLTQAQPFLVELGDQQLEWEYLRRSVPRLPARGKLLSAAEAGGSNVAAFPLLLLTMNGKSYESVDIRKASRGELPWPTGGEDLLYYQGMYCYLAVAGEVQDDPMLAACRHVHERYAAEPLWGEESFVTATPWQTYLGNQHGPFRIGFFRLRERHPS